MLIRHAEKPDQIGKIRGVDENGRSDPNQLSVLGWQRAGALVRYFFPNGAACAEGIATPKTIIACRPSATAQSVRAISTVLPLARALGIGIDDRFTKNDEAEMVAAALAAPGPVLICWSHEPIPGLVRQIAGDLPGFPKKWHGKRFDLVWVLDRTDQGWRFSVVNQMLLPDDGNVAEVAPREAVAVK